MPRPSRTKDPRPDIDVLTLCQEASEWLRRAGFELAYVSMKSEACYFCWPGRTDLLRVAAHKRDNRPLGLGRVVSRLTFHASSGRVPGHMRVSPEKVRAMIALAVGEYFMREGAR